MSDGVLSDESIAAAISRRMIEIDPFDASQLNPASYDLTLGDTVRVYAHWVAEEPLVLGMGMKLRDGRHLHSAVAVLADADVFDVKSVPQTMTYTIGEDGWVLKPGILYLMHTRERVRPGNYVACADGKSSLGRYGIIVHQTAGYIDPGFNGQITLEVTVVNPIRVHAGMRFCQVRFHTVFGVATQYHGNYVGETSRGPVASRAYKQFEK